MIRRIVINNFMAHKQTVIEPAEGLTVLTGPNNCGKSAVVVALQILCTNEPSQAFVRHGEKEASVEVQTSEGHRVTWLRSGGNVSYKINGREIHRLNRKTPEDLHEVLRLPMVEDPDQKVTFDIHFAEQKKPIFLLDEPPSRAAMFFASSSDAALLMKMQQRHKQKVSEQKGTERTLAQQVKRNQRVAEAFVDVPAIDAEVAKVEKLYEAVAHERELLEKLRNVVIELDEAEEQRELWTETSAVVESLAAPPTLQDTEALADLITETIDRTIDAERELERCESVEALAKPPVLHDISNLQRLVDGLAAETGEERLHFARVEALDELDPVPYLEPEDDLHELLNLLDRVSETQVLAADISCCYDSLQPAPKLEDSKELRELTRRLTGMHEIADGRKVVLKELEKLSQPPVIESSLELGMLVRHTKDVVEEVSEKEEALGEIERQLQALRDEVEALVKLNPECPVCGGKIDAERILKSGEHVHV